MLVIRLKRLGKKNQAQFRIVLQEKTQAPRSKALEILGHLNPHVDKDVAFKTDRIKYWLSKGAQPSATIHNLLVNHKVITGKKQRVVKHTKKQETAEKSAENKQPEAKATK